MDEHSNNSTQPAASDPAARLQELRTRVAELNRRVRGERDPKAAAALRAEARKLTALLSELVAASAAKVTKQDTSVIWPRDLNAEPAEAGDSREADVWGPDPEEVARG